MTDQQLRDLLEARVADVTMPDLSGQWPGGPGRRARRRGPARSGRCRRGVALAAVHRRRRGPRPTPAGRRSLRPRAGSCRRSSARAVATEPDATYEGVPVWWSPDAGAGGQPAACGGLPAARGDRPRVRADGQGDATRGGRVLRGRDRVRLVDSRGRQLSVSIDSCLDDVVKPNGYGYRPVHRVDAVADGRVPGVPPGRQRGRLHRRRPASGARSTPATGSPGSSPGSTTTAVVAAVAPRSEARGPVYDVDGRPARRPATPSRSTRRSTSGRRRPSGLTRRHGPGPRPRPGGWACRSRWPTPGCTCPDPEFLVALDRWRHLGAGVHVGLRDERHGGRFAPDCCPVAGWLDDQTLVYESRQTAPGARWPGRSEPTSSGLVSRIEGQYHLASFAALDGSAGGIVMMAVRAPDPRHGVALALTAVAYNLCHHVGSLPDGLGDAGAGTRVGDWVDLLVPLLVLTPALLTVLAAEADRATYVLARGSVPGCTSPGHGIHLAANSIWQRRALPHRGAVGRVRRPLALVRRCRPGRRGRSRGPWPVGRGRRNPLAWGLALASGATWATNAVGGHFTVAGTVVAAGRLGWGWRHRRDQGALWLAVGLAAVPLLAGAWAFGWDFD